jgi:uncharacterized protein (TIGR03089 family)
MRPNDRTPEGYVITMPISRPPTPPGGPPGGSIADLLRARAREGGQRPFVTFHDGASGERTELGHATFANWVAKTANLLAEELELEPGDPLTVRVPTSWTGVVIVAAAWRAGMVVDLDGWSGEAAAVGEHERARGDEPPRLVVVGTGMAARLTTPAGAGIPFAEEVLAFPDDFDDPAVAPQAPALLADGRVWTHGELVATATQRARAEGICEGQRFLSALGTRTAEGLVAGPLLALVVGGGVVLVANTEPERLPAIAQTERCRVILAS